MNEDANDTHESDHTDIEKLKSELKTYLAEKSLSPGTLRTHKRYWDRWVQHCRALPHRPDPRSAPFEAYVALLSRDDVTPKTVSQWTAAVRSYYEQDGHEPAFRAHANRPTWRHLIKGFKRNSVTAGLVSETRKAPPMLRPDVIRLLQAAPEVNKQNQAYRALMLLHLDARIPVSTLARYRISDVQDLEGSQGVELGSVQVPCDHRERIRGVPWDCAACSLRDIVTTRNIPEDLVFSALGDTTKRIGRAFQQVVSRNIYGRYSHLLERGGHMHGRFPIPRSGTTEYDYAGLRRGLVLMYGMEAGPLIIRARAYLAIAWVNGLRMASDLVDVERGDVKEDPDGQGFSITLGRTKSDRSGAHRSTITVMWEGNGGAREFSEYLCVRDAMAGRSGRLFLGSRTVISGRGGAYDNSGATCDRSLAQNDLDRLLALAHMQDRGFTPYSVRRGNATQRERDGQALERIQASLRHRGVNTTRGYIEAGGESHPVEKLMGGL